MRNPGFFGKLLQKAVAPVLLLALVLEVVSPLAIAVENAKSTDTKFPQLPAPEPLDPSEVCTEMPDQDDVYNYDQLEDSEDWGRLAGGLDIDASGAATFHIPIYNYPGRAGLEPNVSLSYHSDAGEGFVADGWQLNGLSSIDRSGKTLNLDAAVEEIQFTNEDRFILDGQRLIPTKGSNGNNNAEYRTLIDGQTKIVSHHKEGYNGPYGFTVYHKNGLISYYGGSENSVVLNVGEDRNFADNKVVANWLLRRVEDREGNFMEYEYTHSNTKEYNSDPDARGKGYFYYPKEIRYTGFAKKGLTVNAPYAKVVFSYQDNQGVQKDSYHAGMKFSNPLQLDRISSYGPDNTLLRNYELTQKISPVSGKKLLTEVAECDGQGTCKEPTVFEYDKGAGEIGKDLEFTFRTETTEKERGSMSAPGPEGQHMATGDVNGDGFDDLITLPSNRTGWLINSETGTPDLENNLFNVRATEYVIHFGDESDDGIGEATRTNFLPYENLTNGEIATYADPVAKHTYSRLFPFDYNADGNMDFLYIPHNFARDPGLAEMLPQNIIEQATSEIYADNYHVLVSQVEGGVWQGFEVVDTFVPREWWNDDFIMAHRAGNNADTTMLTDINGDGRPDLVYSSGIDGKLAYRLLSPEAAQFGPMRVTDLTYPNAIGNFGQEFRDPRMTLREMPPVTLDHNADGKTELLYAIEEEGESRWKLVEFVDGQVEDQNGVQWPVPTEQVTTVFSDDDFLPFVGAQNQENPAWVMKADILDANGDGLSDILFTGTFHVQNLATDDDNIHHALIALSNGRGFEPLQEMRVENLENWSKDEIHVIDMNYDGRSDLLITQDRADDPNQAEWVVLLSDSVNGTSFKAMDLAMPNALNGTLLSETDWDYMSDIPGGRRMSRGDFNGDGIPELLWSFNDPELGEIVSRGQGGRFPNYAMFVSKENNLDRLVRVIDPYGLNVTLEYDKEYRVAGKNIKQVALPINVENRPELEANQVMFPQMVPVSKRPIVTKQILPANDGYSHQTIQDLANNVVGENIVSPNVRHFNYLYSDHVVDVWNGSLGFQNRTVVDALNKVETKFTYGQAKEKYQISERGFGPYRQHLYPYIGVVTKQTTTVDPIQDQVESRINLNESSYEVVRSLEPRAGDDFGLLIAPLQIRLTNTHSEQYDTLDSGSNSAALSVTDKTFHYDAFGNVHRVTQDISRPGLEEQYHEEVEYRYNNDPGTWLIGKLTAIDETATNGDWEISNSTRYDQYKASSHLPTVYRTRVGTPEEMTNKVTYDKYGNVLKTESVDSEGNSRWVETEMETTINLFPRCITNQLGHKQAFYYNFDYGLLTGTTNPQGLSNWFSYDYFGRQRGTHQPDGNFSRTVTTNTEGDFAYTTVITDSFGRLTTSYHDMFGRTLMSESLGFDGMRRLDGKVVYNAKGQVKYLVGPLTFDELDNGGQGSVTSFWYDEIGRTTLTKLDAENANEIDAVQLRTNYLPGYGVEEVNGRGLTTSSANFDVLGQAKTVVDANGEVMNYVYGPFGPISITDAAGNKTKIKYDQHGRKIEINEPNSGKTSYRYDNFDRPIWVQDNNQYLISQNPAQLNALGGIEGEVLSPEDVATITEYDVLDRPVSQKVFGEDETKYFYDGAEHGLGLINEIQGPNDTLYQFTYDDLGRPDKEIVSIDEQTYQTAYSYNGRGLLEATSLPQVDNSPAVEIVNNYDAFGYLESLTDGNTGETYWQLDEINRYGAPVQETLGNGIVNEYGYDLGLGNLTEVYAHKPNSFEVQHWSYQYDQNGNVSRRDNLINRWSEEFEYDNLDRLVKSSEFYGLIDSEEEVESDRETSLAYDAIGNIVRSDLRPGVAAWQYGEGNAGPSAVTTIGNETFKYDGNGNMTSLPGSRLQYNGFNKIERVSEQIPNEAGELEWKIQAVYSYGAFDDRIKEVTPQDTTYFIGKTLEHTIDKKTGNQSLHYNFGKFRLSTQEVDDQWSALQASYAHVDALGSVDAVSGEVAANGQVAIQEFSYDPWGNRRDPRDWSDLDEEETAELAADSDGRFGFTGHWQEDSFAWIDMGGRLYLPTIGRTMQADPFVASPANMQAYNRYSYVHNNPTTLVDPTGFQVETKGSVGVGDTIFTAESLNQLNAGEAPKTEGQTENGGSASGVIQLSVWDSSDISFHLSSNRSNAEHAEYISQITDEPINVGQVSYGVVLPIPGLSALGASSSAVPTVGNLANPWIIGGAVIGAGASGTIGWGISADKPMQMSQTREGADTDVDVVPFPGIGQSTKNKRIILHFIDSSAIISGAQQTGLLAIHLSSQKGLSPSSYTIVPYIVGTPTDMFGGLVMKALKPQQIYYFGATKPGMDDSLKLGIAAKAKGAAIYMYSAQRQLIIPPSLQNIATSNRVTAMSKAAEFVNIMDIGQQDVPRVARIRHAISYYQRAELSQDRINEIHNNAPRDADGNIDFHNLFSK